MKVCLCHNISSKHLPKDPKAAVKKLKELGAGQTCGSCISYLRDKAYQKNT